jgi:RNA polymerase-binding transcription factor DksA
MKKELEVLLIIKKKFQSLINTFNEIINSSVESTYYINITKHSQINEYIEMYNSTFNESHIQETINELKNALDAVNKEIYGLCDHCFVVDQVESGFDKLVLVSYCDICKLNKKE